MRVKQMQINVMERTLKDIVRRVWPLRMLVLLILRPRRFLDDFAYSLIDYWRFRRSVLGFRAFLRQTPQVSAHLSRPGLLFVAGRAMNVQWCQLWSVLGGVYRRNGFRSFVLTSKNEPIRNLYFRLFGVECIYLEDLSITSTPVPSTVADDIGRLETFQEFKDFTLEGAPAGQVALSTYSRLRATGIIDVANSETREEIRSWLVYLYQTLVTSERVYQQKNIQMLVFTEVFMEEYGAFYYGALNRNLNIIRIAGTVRDDAIIAQHLTRQSDRTHHAAVTAQSWKRICGYADSPTIDRELHQNFLDRYGDRWSLSKRNQPNTRIMSPAEAKALLGVTEDRKIAVIFSHILYDTLFFFGKDLFPCYADWFVETVKAACLNPKVQWFVKVHPSNLWRGELEYFFGGKCEEVRLIERCIGQLPDHVTIVYPDTPISPYTWLQIADYGITVRGTTGIELGALGKAVITAGSGRYEAIGFTINPQTADEYSTCLAKLPGVPEPTQEQQRLGARFAYATFCMKPFTLDFLRPVTRAGKSTIFSSDDLVYLGNFSSQPAELPASISRFVQWSFDRDSIDLLNEWPMAVLNQATSMEMAS